MLLRMALFFLNYPVRISQKSCRATLNVRVTHKQYGTGIVIAQKENTIKVRFPEGLEKSFIIHTKFPARPTFEDDEQVVEAFTEYDRLTREIQGLKKLLEIEKAKVQTTIL